MSVPCIIGLQSRLCVSMSIVVNSWNSGLACEPELFWLPERFIEKRSIFDASYASVALSVITPEAPSAPVSTCE